jgi:hypothetical protein
VAGLLELEALTEGLTEVLTEALTRTLQLAKAALVLALPPIRLQSVQSAQSA